MSKGYTLKRQVTREDITEYIKRLDKRAISLTSQQITDIITSGFGELSTYKFPFSGETVVNLKPYMDAGEEKITIEIEEDVHSVYDLYVTLHSTQKVDFVDSNDEMHGTPISYETGLHRLKKMIYRDDFDTSKVHIQLKNAPLNVQNAVIRYHYFPTENFTELYTNAQGRLAIQYAMASCLYDYLHDVKRSEQKRAALKRVTGSNMSDAPESFEPYKENMFPAGV